MGWCYRKTPPNDLLLNLIAKWTGETHGSTVRLYPADEQRYRLNQTEQQYVALQDILVKPAMVLAMAIGCVPKKSHMSMALSDSCPRQRLVSCRHPSFD